MVSGMFFLWSCVCETFSFISSNWGLLTGTPIIFTNFLQLQKNKLRLGVFGWNKIILWWKLKLRAYVQASILIMQERGKENDDLIKAFAVYEARNKKGCNENIWKAY